MRFRQQRTPAGCAWAVAAGWLAWSLVLRNVGLVDYILVGFLIAFGIFLTAYRKIYPDAILTVDELPKPGATFHGKVETPLKNEPAAARVRLSVVRMRGRNRRAQWQSECDAHPMRGEHGIVFPIDIAVPPDVESRLDASSVWRVAVSAGLYRASFKLATPRA
jgi:hypothetical protein